MSREEFICGTKHLIRFNISYRASTGLLKAMIALALAILKRSMVNTVRISCML